MRVQGTSNFTLLYRNATTYGITDEISLSHSSVINIWTFNATYRMFYPYKFIYNVHLHKINYIHVYTVYTPIGGKGRCSTRLDH